MKITTKGRYSLQVLLDLAQHREDGYIPLKTIAERQGISKRYLDQIMMILNRTNFLESTRGAQGGYKLAKAPDQYTMGGILRLSEGGFAPLACLENGGEDCERYGSCIARHAWQGLDEAMAKYLDSTTLQDILDQFGGEIPAGFGI
jgi:Rrf2 family protein